MTPLRERLLGNAIINLETGCWEWTGTRNPKGYGMLRTGGRRRQLVHRVSYEMTYGPIPEGLQIDHLCRVRNCLNPAHLEAVTNQVNTLRGETVTAANAAKTHCSQGHEFTPENTHMEAYGARRCLTCRRKRNRERMRVVRAERRGLSPDCASGCHEPLCDGRHCSCDCHRSGS